MTAPPGTSPALGATDARNQSDAASAAWKARRARRSKDAARSVSQSFIEAVPLGIAVPRVQRWTGEQRIRQAMAR